MIRFATGDVLRAEVDALVNTVNCVGIMGRGIALQFRNAFPDNFKAYVQACKREEVQPGRMFVFETGMMHPRYIINFPTKRHWRGKSRMEDIESGLEALRNEIITRRIRSIAIPPLGSGLGGLYWPDVRARIEAVLHDVKDVDVVVYEPTGAPDAQTMARTRDVPNMTAGRAALVVLMHRYLEGLLDPFVHSPGGTQANVLHAGSGSATEAALCKSAVWTLCRKSSPRSENRRGTSCFGLCRWRRCP